MVELLNNCIPYMETKFVNLLAMGGNSCGSLKFKYFLVPYERSIAKFRPL